MKLRASKSEATMRLKILLNDGYTPVATVTSKTGYKVTLCKGKNVVHYNFKNNGWLEIT